jgi:hypothetical protein
MPRQARTQIRDYRRRIAQDGREGRDFVFALERALARDHLVEENAERKDIGARIGRLARRLFRCHVAGRAQNPAFTGEIGTRSDRRRRAIGCRRHDLGETEVEHLDDPVVLQHHVRGLEVAVRDTLGVCVPHGIGDRDGEIEKRCERITACRHPFGQRMALEKLHRQKRVAVGFFDRVDGDDVRMAKRRHGLRFTLEALPAIGILCHLRRQDLERDLALEPGIEGAIDLAHAAGADGRQDLVVCEPLADHGTLDPLDSMGRTLGF